MQPIRTFFTFELAKRLEGTGVMAVAFHPGWIKSNLAQNAPPLLKVMAPLINVWAKETCEVGVYVAAAKEIEKVSGVYFDDKMQIVPFHQKYDADTGRKLWNMSEKLTSISAVYPQNRPQNER